MRKETKEYYKLKKEKPKKRDKRFDKLLQKLANN